MRTKANFDVHRLHVLNFDIVNEKELNSKAKQPLTPKNKSKTDIIYFESKNDGLKTNGLTKPDHNNNNKENEIQPSKAKFKCVLCSDEIKRSHDDFQLVKRLPLKSQSPTSSKSKLAPKIKASQNLKKSRSRLLKILSKRKIKKYSRDNIIHIDDIKRKLSQHSVNCSNRVKETLRIFSKDSVLRSKRKEEETPSKDCTNSNATDEVKVLYTRKNLRCAKEIKTTRPARKKSRSKHVRVPVNVVHLPSRSWSVDDIFGFKRSNRPVNPVVYMHQRSLFGSKLRRKTKKPSKECKPYKFLLTPSKEFPITNTICPVGKPSRARVKHSKHKQPEPCYKYKLLDFPDEPWEKPRTNRVTVCCGPDKPLPSTAADADCRARQSHHSRLNDEDDDYGDGKSRLLMIFKYMLLGIMLLFWLPCILIILFCWALTFPLRPQTNTCKKSKDQTNTCKKSKDDSRDTNLLCSFINWIRGAEWKPQACVMSAVSGISGKSPCKSGRRQEPDLPINDQLPDQPRRPEKVRYKKFVKQPTKCDYKQLGAHHEYNLVDFSDEPCSKSRRNRGRVYTSQSAYCVPDEHLPSKAVDTKYRARQSKSCPNEVCYVNTTEAPTLPQCADACDDDADDNDGLTMFFKYMLFGLVILVWLPCIVVVLLCWALTYPLRPQTETSKESKDYSRNTSPIGCFINWIRSAEWRPNACKSSVVPCTPGNSPCKSGKRKRGHVKRDTYAPPQPSSPQKVGFKKYIEQPKPVFNKYNVKCIQKGKRIRNDDESKLCHTCIKQMELNKTCHECLKKRKQHKQSVSPKKLPKECLKKKKQHKSSKCACKKELPKATVCSLKKSPKCTNIAPKKISIKTKCRKPRSVIKLESQARRAKQKRKAEGPFWKRCLRAIKDIIEEADRDCPMDYAKPPNPCLACCRSVCSGFWHCILLTVSACVWFPPALCLYCCVDLYCKFG